MGRGSDRESDRYFTSETLHAIRVESSRPDARRRCRIFRSRLSFSRLQRQLAKLAKRSNDTVDLTSITRLSRPTGRESSLTRRGFALVCRKSDCRNIDYLKTGNIRFNLMLGQSKSFITRFSVFRKSRTSYLEIGSDAIISTQKIIHSLLPPPHPLFLSLWLIKVNDLIENLSAPQFRECSKITRVKN